MVNFQNRLCMVLDPDPVFKKCMDPDPVCPERLDPDPSCPERLDPDLHPANIRPDPQPCSYRLNPSHWHDAQQIEIGPEVT